MSTLLLLDILLAALAVFLVKKWRATSKASMKQFPPGPRPLPLLGNVLDMPATHQWKTFAEWQAKWGDILSVTLFGQRIVVLSSVEAATELLERRGAIYSDRPAMPMAGQLMGWDQIVTLSPYGERFRDIRRLLHRYIGSRGQLEKVAPFYNLIEEQTRRSLARTAEQPEQFAEHIRDNAGAIILRMGYGYRTKENDPLVAVVDRAVAGFVAASQPGSFLVDILPALQWVPSWFPGAGWKRKAALWRGEFDEMADAPFAYSHQESERGQAEPNFVEDHLGQIKTPTDEYHLKMAAASLYSGGADTTVSAINSFFLAMTLYPDVQKKAQREIDAVIGTGRLPTMDDRDRLPYVRALVSEVFRWNPIGPLGVPHRSIENDVYRGYFLPKGTLVIANIWHMLRDPKVYTDPLAFNPERFLEGGGNVPERDPRSAVFGFGRRICPGLNLAEASVFTSCAMALAVFDIRKAVVNGVEITPAVEYTSGTISHPVPFKCSISPRSEKAGSLLLA